MSLNKTSEVTTNNSNYELIPIHKLPQNYREECHQLLTSEFPEYFQKFGLVFALLVLCSIPF